jgi:hypothetical protein
MQRVTAPCNIFWSPLCSSVSARIFFGQQLLFFISSSSACNVRARAEFFFGRFCTALSARAPEFFIWGLSGRILLRAQNLFFVVSGQQLLRMQKLFFLCSVTSAQSVWAP